EVRSDGLRLGLLKPETYMNDSGRSIGPALRFYKLPPESLLVVHDDVDLEQDRLQARLGAVSPGTTGFGRSCRRSARPRSPACGSASAAPAAVILVRSPTTCSRRSSPRSMSRPSWRRRPTPSRRSPTRASSRRSAASTDSHL